MGHWIGPLLRDWIVLRFGYSLLGITNHPATAEATGLEVDKLDRATSSSTWKTISIVTSSGRRGFMGERGIRYVINDSWEAGSQNWTDNMIAQFKSGAATIRFLGCLFSS